MSKRHLYLLAALLAGTGLGFFGYKAGVLGFPLLPETTTVVWNVEARITFTAQGKPAKVLLYIPRSSFNLTVTDENFVSQEFGFTLKKERGNRQAVWSKRTAEGRQIFYYRATIRQAEPSGPIKPAPAPTPPQPLLAGPALEAARALVSQIRVRSADTETFVSELITLVNRPQPDPNVAFLFEKKPSRIKKLEIAANLLNVAGLPARTVHGIRLEQRRESAPFVHWLEVYEAGQWRPFDALTGEAGVPPDYLPWWRGDGPFLEGKGATRLRATLSVAANQEEALLGAIEQSRLAIPRLFEFSLFSLPLETQAVYRILLMVPLGALVLVILRNVVGVKTFGTFMPILIGLAFRETQLLWGIILFSVIMAMGLTVRFYLEHLRLLLVPRLASILIVVVLLMASLSVLSHRLGLERGLSVALFPMVILTMTIERMCIVWEERGPNEAIQQGLGSLLVAALTYLIMTISYVEHLLFVFPELLLVLLASTLLLGRYSGFRLLELWRFKVLAQGGGT